MKNTRSNNTAPTEAGSLPAASFDTSAVEWFCVRDAAKRIGVHPATLKEWCNYIDPRTGQHAPKIEHMRLGTRGRKNARLGLRGTIKIHRQAVANFIAARLYTPPDPPAPKPIAPRKPAYRPMFWKPRAEISC